MRTIGDVNDWRTEMARRRNLPSTGLPVLAAITSVLLATACSGTATAPPGPEVTTTAAAPERAAPAAAMAAYGEFWRVSELAFAAPSAQDWETELMNVARGQALTDVVIEIQNYASVPAHVEGTITHEPSPDPAVAPLPDRVTVLDCVDITGSRLVADRDGSVLDDRANQTPRYRYRAEVVRDTTGRWLVETTAPSLDQPC